MKFEDAFDAILDYHRRGFIVTPLRGKRPILTRWPTRELNEEELQLYFVDGRNVGLVLGGPAGIVDVDLDNPVAVAAANLLLPPTLESGRKWSSRSHRWYLCVPAPASRKYALPKGMAERLVVDPGEEMLVEIRSTGQLTMIPPSVHPVDGDRCLWHPGEIREMGGRELASLVFEVAVAALLVLNRPLGSRTWFAVRAAGYLGPRVGPERAEKIVAATSAGFEDEEHDERMRAVRSVLRQSVGADPAADASIAAELERLVPGVPGLIARWFRRNRREQGGAK
jgi:hypothetical protein